MVTNIIGFLSIWLSLLKVVLISFLVTLDCKKWIYFNRFYVRFFTKRNYQAKSNIWNLILFPKAMTFGSIFKCLSFSSLKAIQAVGRLLVLASFKQLIGWIVILCSQSEQRFAVHFCSIGFHMMSYSFLWVFLNFLISSLLKSIVLSGNIYAC